MSFTPPITYAQGDSVSADDVNDNYQAARDYVNGQISINDISDDSLDTQHIIRPDLVWTDGRFSQSWRLTSGPIYWYRNLYNRGSDGNAIFLTAHTKNTNFKNRVEYLHLSDVGQSLYLEQASNVIVEFDGWAAGISNPVITDNGDSNAFYLFVDDSIQTETRCYVSHYDGPTGVGTPDKSDSDLEDRYSALTFIWSGFLGAGWHTFDVRCNALLEYCIVRSRNFFIEVSY